MFSWIIGLATLFAILSRPFKLPEWISAMTGAILLLLFREISFPSFCGSILEGTDVYFFLIGMMLISEQARAEGVFDWVANVATRRANGSEKILFALIYFFGIVTTIFLSNDATAVVLTPAVYAAIKKAKAKPTPHLFACAMVANAASFFLPISNPANIVLFQDHLPSLFLWIKAFFVPSMVATLITFGLLYLYFKKDLSEPLEVSSSQAEENRLSACGKLCLVGMGVLVAVLLASSALQWKLGLPTFISATVLSLGIALKKQEWPKKMLKQVSIGVVPLVAGLFVIVEAISEHHALSMTESFLKFSDSFSGVQGKLIAAFGFGTISNIVNNLPVGLIAAKGFHAVTVSDPIRDAVLIGVDLGPNLSVTGSLATLLWLMAIRREGESVSGGDFLKAGALIMPIALLAAVLAI